MCVMGFEETVNNATLGTEGVLPVHRKHLLLAFNSDNFFI